jgi:tetratricopeptide (TPR) repeat protein
MLRYAVVGLILAWSLGLSGQQGTSSQANPPASSPSSSSSSDSAKAGSSRQPKAPDFNPPRSDSVDASALPGTGESSSKETKIDLSPPENDARQHPQSAEALDEAEREAAGGKSVSEFRPWDPHKAAKDVEVGDFYFKRKNYKAAEDRYREALYYKDNDAIATFRLAVCLEKTDRPDDARAMYESYLRILPHGPQAPEAHRAIDRLKTRPDNSKAAK